MTLGVNEDSKVIVQGITGHQGSIHTAEMLAFGTRIVGGVSPGKGGQMVGPVPVFDNMDSALKHLDADCSVLFVPAPHCREAVKEAVDAGIGTIVIITEHMPVHDSMWIRRYAAKMGARIIGPNCPGICIPGVAKIAIMPNSIFAKGNTAVISRSGTLTYEIVSSLSDNGIGQRCCIGIGGDLVIGTTMAEALDELLDDSMVDSIVMIGEIGGTAEQDAAEAYANKPKKPLIAYVAGRTAPEERRMGHAGAIISGGSGSYSDKVRALESAGIRVSTRLNDIPVRLSQLMSEW
ncbi:MAG TPA: succinate--CoA ligase subunit alpha [Methanomassiliicoccales archaeon]|nr:succinate--CoA ligase subunit alpha [Methanomassiliicoccales archaeon]